MDLAGYVYVAQDFVTISRAAAVTPRARTFAATTAPARMAPDPPGVPAAAAPNLTCRRGLHQLRRAPARLPGQAPCPARRSPLRPPARPVARGLGPHGGDGHRLFGSMAHSTQTWDTPHRTVVRRPLKAYESRHNLRATTHPGDSYDHLGCTSGAVAGTSPLARMSPYSRVGITAKPSERPMCRTSWRPDN